MTDQDSITIVAPVVRARTRDLELALEEMGADPADNGVLPFARFANVHFGRLVLLPESVDARGNGVPPTLVLATNIDGRAEAHLRDLAARGSAGLDRLFGHCEGYPPAADRSAETRLRYLRSHRIRTHTLFVNTRGRTVERIARERQLAEAIRGFLAGPGANGDRTAASAVERVRRFLGEEPELRWALAPAESEFAFRLVRTVRLVGFGLLIVAALLALFVAPLLIFLFPQLMYDFPWLIAIFPLPWIALAFFLLVLRLHELNNLPDDYRPPGARLLANESSEDLGTQNQLSAVGYLQKGFFRTAITRVVLWLMQFSTDNLFYRGHLAGVDTIHFARWVMLGRGRVIFFSNYDGSLESYNDDFVDRVPFGLNLVFSNGQGWPPTKFLAFGGARDEQAFKLYLRDHQVRTHVWYAAAPYRGLTAVNLSRNSKIRAGLARRMGEREAAEWLRLV